MHIALNKYVTPLPILHKESPTPHNNPSIICIQLKDILPHFLNLELFISFEARVQCASKACILSTQCFFYDAQNKQQSFTYKVLSG
jgi:hypothetical protein